MADIKGIGNCGICEHAIEPGQPIRHFKGHQMAHKECMAKYSADDQRLSRATETVARLDAQIAAMIGDRDAAQRVINELQDVQQVAPRQEGVKP